MPRGRERGSSSRGRWRTRHTHSRLLHDCSAQTLDGAAGPQGEPSSSPGLATAGQGPVAWARGWRPSPPLWPQLLSDEDEDADRDTRHLLLFPGL